MPGHSNTEETLKGEVAGQEARAGPACVPRGAWPEKGAGAPQGEVKKRTTSV